MARKITADLGNDNYTMLIDLIMTLTPNQVKKEYERMKITYSKRAKRKHYNELGQEDEEGKIILTEHQYKSIRVKYGDTYIYHAFKRLTDYIKWLEEHPDHIGKDGKRGITKLNALNKRTHDKELSYGGWVYDEMKNYICVQDDLKDVIINPFLINDYDVAKKYIECLSPEMRKQPDVIWLVEKFPELNDLLEEQ